MVSPLHADPPNEHAEPIMDSVPAEWQFFDAPWTWVLTTNRDYSIEILDRGKRDTRATQQPEWASVFPNDTTHENTVRVCYRGAPFCQVHVLQLDEFRKTIVAPQIDHDAADDETDRMLTQFEMHLSRIMSGGALEGYEQGLDVRIVD